MITVSRTAVLKAVRIWAAKEVWIGLFAGAAVMALSLFILLK